MKTNANIVRTKTPFKPRVIKTIRNYGYGFWKDWKDIFIKDTKECDGLTEGITEESEQRPSQEG